MFTCHPNVTGFGLVVIESRCWALPRANPYPEPDEHQGAGDKQQVDREPVENAFVSSLRHGVPSSLRSLRRKNVGGCECIHKTGLFTPS